jgi:serine/threonine protein kinase
VAYQVVQRLGRGGMGVVDLATGPEGEPVAMKRIVLAGSAREMDQARIRIRREAQALAALDHPNVVRLLDVVPDDDGIVLVLPYLDGGTLADRVHQHGPLPPDEVERIAYALLGALAAAHRAGIIHRDIKPANVLFDAHGTPHLADFGIAAMHDATVGLTRTGMMMGTPQFMAPEQARGERATAASDVFSLGATLVYAATGALPYGRAEPAVLVQRAAQGRVSQLPPSIPPRLRLLLEPMTAVSPSHRPSAAALLGGPAGTAPVAPAATRRPPRDRSPWRARLPIIVAAGVVALVAGSLVGARLGSADQPDASTSIPPAPAPTTTTTACTDLPYQPCGRPVAAFTDGRTCTDGHADYDGSSANGCEAAPDTVDGTSLTHTISANLVPADDVDSYPFHVSDDLQWFCDGEVRVTLTSPAGAAMRLDVLQGTKVLGSATSTDGEAATVRLSEPSCWHDDATDLVARVSAALPIKVADDYRLERSGSY